MGSNKTACQGWHTKADEAGTPRADEAVRRGWTDSMAEGVRLPRCWPSKREAAALQQCQLRPQVAPCNPQM